MGVTLYLHSGPLKPAIPHNALSDAEALAAWHRTRYPRVAARGFTGDEPVDLTGLETLFR